MDTQVYEIHKHEGKTYGSIIDWKPPSQVQREYDYSYDLRGETAHFIIVTNDASLKKEDAINFAKAICDGSFKTFHIDLSQLGRFPKGENK